MHIRKPVIFRDEIAMARSSHSRSLKEGKYTSDAMFALQQGILNDSRSAA